MSLEQDRLLQYVCLGIQQEVLLPTLRSGTILPARLIPIDAVRAKMQDSPEDTTMLFAPEEISHSLRYRVRPHEHFAARLAAKQIVMELLGSDAIGWHDVSIRNNDYNCPYFVFSDTTQSLLNERGIEAVHVSLSHEDPVALAFCAVEKDDYTASTGIVRIGTDVCFDDPFQSATIKRTTTFNEEEIEVARKQEFPAQRLAMYYAAKESVIKILETLSGWIWMEIVVHEGEEGIFQVGLLGSAKERLEEIGAVEIVTSLSYREGIGALAFSAAVTPSIDRADA